MSSGIRAEVRIDEPAECPVASASADTGTAGHSLSKGHDPEMPGRVTEEFVLETGGLAENPEFVDGDLTEVFSYESNAVYRFNRAKGLGCPCECVERFDCPVADVQARDGALHLVFHAPDMSRLQDAVSAIRERYPGADVRRLLRSRDEDGDDHDLVVVDRGELTDRQHEVLETAHELGYFDHPKGANAGEVASALDITTSTFTEHLSAAQRKLLDALLAE